MTIRYYQNWMLCPVQMSASSFLQLTTEGYTDVLKLGVQLPRQSFKQLELRIKTIYPWLENEDNFSVRDAYSAFYLPTKVDEISILTANYEGKEFSQDFKNFINELIEKSIYEPQLLIEDFKIKEFKASTTWIRGFLKRNHFNTRKAQKK